MTKPIELEDALDELLQHLQPQQRITTVNLTNALKRYLAQDIYAPIDVPTFNRSAMDGYGVKSELTRGATKETPVKFKVVAEMAAGATKDLDLQDDHAVRIATGAPIPDGIDAVVRQEDTNQGEDIVEIHPEIHPFTNYGKKGEDIQKGEFILAKNTKLNSIHIGMIASLGITKVEVFEQIRIGIINTGSELVEPGIPLEDGQIYNSVKYILLTRLKDFPICFEFAKSLPDDAHVVCEEIQQQIDQVDLIITTGGVSVGKKDIMHDCLKVLGAKQLFWRVNIQPGTPMLASTYQGKLIVSLSGNPFAALTTFELLVKPILLAFMHTKDLTQDKKEAILMHDFPKASKRRRFVRAYYESGEVYLPTSKHSSSVLSSMLGCNCFIDIPEGASKLTKGTPVQVVLLD